MATPIMAEGRRGGDSGPIAKARATAHVCVDKRLPATIRAVEPALGTRYALAAGEDDR